MAWLVLFLMLAIPFLLLAFLSFRADLAEPKHCSYIMLSSSGRPFSVLTIADAFDPDHALIWDTQIPVLQLLAAAGQKGISVEHQYPHYARSAGMYPELHDGSSFRRWIEFLEEAQLIAFDRHRVFLTLQGDHFVKDWVGLEASGALRNWAASQQ